jgi:branched-chain amino acid aminotransferase
MINISITKVKNTRVNEIDFNNIPFGKIFSDHIFLADCNAGTWENLKIIPYGPIKVMPSISAIHYGQSIFEGMKAYYQPDGRIGLFRWRDNFIRMNRSAERMGMPNIPEEIFYEGLISLLKLDREWVPKNTHSSLYIRPFYFSTDETLGVKPAEKYRFMIFTCPVGPYFTEPLRCYVETTFARSFEGGPGYAKAAGNYGASFYPLRLAQAKGYHQIIWLDSVNHEFIEESGAMNIMAVISNTLVTPSLSTSKLAGITRQSIIDIAKSWGIQVEERNLSINELVTKIETGEVQEVFGCGTAAQIAPISVIGYKSKDYYLPTIPANELLSHKIGNYLTNLKYGLATDTWGWMEII